MKNIFLILQIFISIILIVFILLQAKGTGLGSAWGGTGAFYKTKRGVEKVVFYLTIVFLIFFCLSSFLVLLI